MAKKLGARQQRFVDEYLIDLNGTQAAIRAGYSPNTAAEQSSRLLTNVNISNAIGRALAARSVRTGINQDRIVTELAKIAFVNSVDVINMDDADISGSAQREDTAAIASVKVKRIPTEDGDIVEREVKTYDKIKALELLGKHLGMFTDKIDISTDITVDFGGVGDAD